MRYDVTARVAVHGDDAMRIRVSVPQADDEAQARAAVAPVLSPWPHVIESVRAVRPRKQHHRKREQER